ncbi:phytoene/squalene synthetase [Aliiruegeria haliotis]|uniref:Phytoene/squalene synthetase n=1 Tax=Aliiruegeria haliotis TaxID=1280846 RepID=A0A2T0RJW0_9RHOB|nr:squalene/phytoene synthase family protein [Aliiruegeria haliotis]PRY21402.1 phytoene/squalene synthetase [Aliiruegeria haliotis]
MSIADCAALVERGDPDRFLATMAAPVAARAVLFPLYAFNVEITRIPWVSQEAMICEMRLQWWYDVLGEIGAGEPARAHEVAAPLTDVLRDAGDTVAPLRALVEARRWDIYTDPFEDAAALEAYLDATGAGLMWSAAIGLGATSVMETAVREFGWAAALASYLRAIPELEARGRRPLVDGRATAVEALARQGLERLERARETKMPRQILPALWAGWRARTTLRAAVQDPRRVADGTLQESEFSRRFGLFSRTSLRRW